MRFLLFYIGVLSQSVVNALPQPFDDLFQDSSAEISAIDSISLNPANPSSTFYQTVDFGDPIDTNIFTSPETPFDIPVYEQSSIPLEPSGGFTPSTDTNGVTAFNLIASGSTDQNIPTLQGSDVQLGFEQPEIQQVNNQPNAKTPLFPELPDIPIPYPLPPVHLLEPSCPGGKKAYCCSGGKVADNIAKGCSPWTLNNWLCHIKYFAFCCKGYVKDSTTDAEECEYAP